VLEVVGGFIGCRFDFLMYVSFDFDLNFIISLSVTGASILYTCVCTMLCVTHTRNTTTVVLVVDEVSKRNSLVLLFSIQSLSKTRDKQRNITVSADVTK
jgi:hypothetical protein